MRFNLSNHISLIGLSLQNVMASSPGPAVTAPAPTATTPAPTATTPAPAATTPAPASTVTTPAATTSGDKIIKKLNDVTEEKLSLFIFSDLTRNTLDTTSNEIIRLDIIDSAVAKYVAETKKTLDPKQSYRDGFLATLYRSILKGFSFYEPAEEIQEAIKISLGSIFDEISELASKKDYSFSKDLQDLIKPGHTVISPKPTTVDEKIDAILAEVMTGVPLKSFPVPTESISSVSEKPISSSTKKLADVLSEKMGARVFEESTSSDSEELDSKITRNTLKDSTETVLSLYTSLVDMSKLLYLSKPDNTQVYLKLSRELILLPMIYKIILHSGVDTFLQIIPVHDFSECHSETEKLMEKFFDDSKDKIEKDKEFKKTYITTFFKQNIKKLDDLFTEAFQNPDGLTLVTPLEFFEMYSKAIYIASYSGEVAMDMGRMEKEFQTLEKQMTDLGSSRCIEGLAKYLLSIEGEVLTAEGFKNIDPVWNRLSGILDIGRADMPVYGKKPHMTLREAMDFFRKISIAAAERASIKNILFYSAVVFIVLDIGMAVFYMISRKSVE